MIKQLDHLNLSVRSLPETISWYRDLFGFDVVERGTSSGIPFAVLRAGDAMLCIYEHGSRRSAVDRSETVHGINHFALRITDPTAFLDAVDRLGIEYDYGDGAIDYPHSTSWYVRDPSGYQIEVVAWNDDVVRFPAPSH